MNVVGISSFFHDSACCLIKGGNLIAAAEEERFTRIKHDPSLPLNAYKYCLNEANLSVADIDVIAYYEIPKEKLSRQISASGGAILFDSRFGSSRYDTKHPEREIRERLGFDGPIEYVSHHLSHAASSYYYSGFDDAAIFTVDGVGEWATTTYGVGQKGIIDIFEKVDFPNSLGLFYSAMTSYLGFEVNEGEYKIMGLAPYGKPTYVDKLRKLIVLQENGQYKLNMKFFDFSVGARMFSENLVKLLGPPPRKAESEIHEYHHDIARSTQLVLEEVLLDKVHYLYKKVPSKNLCMAGGVALNCVANSKLLNQSPYDKIFVQPAAGDSGASLGAAALVYQQHTGKRISTSPLRHTFYGPGYSNKQVSAIIDAAELKLKPCSSKKETSARTADLLAAGKIVGWFQGRMEFGPRALGGRSILADPRIPDVKDRINAMVKKREGFRPFAPAVLEDKSDLYFDIDHPSPFMLETFQVIGATPLPAITHVDNSARVQTVTDSDNPILAMLLREFYNKTKCPILLNTSFNIRGEPIVMSPVDALFCFLNSEIDILVLEDYILTRDLFHPFLYKMAERSHTISNQRPRAISDIAYTFI